MAFEEKALEESHEVTRLAIQSNTQISSRATNIISKLSPSEELAKPALIILRAESRWASKLISVVEIAKRDLETRKIKVYQYNALSSEIVEVDRKPKATVGLDVKDGEASDDGAFETMGASGEGGKKKRSVPVMTAYLTKKSVKALKSEFGEQTSS